MNTSGTCVHSRLTRHPAAPPAWHGNLLPRKKCRGCPVGGQLLQSCCHPRIASFNPVVSPGLPPSILLRRLRLARTGQHVQAHVLSCVLGLSCAAASPAAPACAPSAALRRRSVMEGGPCPLLASAPASGSPARSSSTKRVPPRQPHVLVRGLCQSAEAVLGNCLQRRVLQGPGVGVLADCTKSSK